MTATSSWTSRKCEIHEVHMPKPVENVVVTIAGVDVVVCPTGLRNLQVAIDYMSGAYAGPASPNRIGKATWDLAQAEVTHRETACSVSTSAAPVSTTSPAV